MNQQSGPHLTMAVLCRDVIEDKQGILSLIHIVNKVTATWHGPDAPEKMPPIRVPLYFVMTLKTGAAEGRHKVVVDLLSPTGGLTPIHENEALELRKGMGSAGHNQVTRVSIAYGSEGIYWYRVFVDDVFVTQVPLEVEYLRTQEAGQTGNDRETT